MSKNHIEINTDLINKKEIFKMLALAHSTGLPILLVGNPGVGKTKIVLDYAKSWMKENFMDKVFILETDEGTKSSEIKGTPDIESIFKENKFKLNTPIVNAEVIVVNEIDKASSNIRNSLLGVMNEKVLFNGKEKIACNWKLFIGTCNEIPKEEINSPFWDRFILKQTVSRVSAGDLVNYFNKGDKKYSEKFNINVLDKSELDSIQIPISKMEHFLGVGYSKLTDRSLTYVPTIVRSITSIWNYSIDKALVKAADIMIDNVSATALQEKLMSRELKEILNKVNSLWSYGNPEALDLEIQDIDKTIKDYLSKGTLDESSIETIEGTISYVLENHPIKKFEKEQEKLAELFTEKKDE